MRFPAFNRLSPIGIDIDSRFVNAAQLSRTPAGWSLAAAARIPLIDRAEQRKMDAGEAAAILSALNRQGFHGKRIVLSMPEDKLRSEVIETPPRSSGAPIDAIAAAELARLYDYDPNSAEMVCWDLPAQARAKESTQVYAVACPHNTAIEILDPFEAAHAEVIALDGNSHALSRVCGDRLSQSGITAILLLGLDYALLEIIYHGMIIYKRAIPEAAFICMESTIINKLGIDRQATEYLLAEADLDSPQNLSASAMPMAHAIIKSYLDQIAQELDAPFAYAMHQYGCGTIDGLLVMGFGASVRGANKYLADKLQLNVQVVKPSDVVICPSNIDKSLDPSIIASIGLAMYE